MSFARDLSSLLHTGVMDGSEAVIFVDGTNVGASILTYFLSSGLSGVARQVAYYQVGYNSVAALTMIPLFYLETLGGALLHKSADERGFPYPRRIHLTTTVLGMPSAV